VGSLFGDVGSAIAKRSVGIAVWEVWECDRFLRILGVRSLLGYGSAIAVWGCGGAIKKLNFLI